MIAWLRKPEALISEAPCLEAVMDKVRVVLAGENIVQTRSAYRVVRAGQAPFYYVPSKHVDINRLHPSDRQGTTDWGGRLAFFHLIGPDGLIPNAVWFHPEPPEPFAPLRNHLAFFPQVLDEAWVGRARVKPFSDAYDGGWDTMDQSGPHGATEEDDLLTPSTLIRAKSYVGAARSPGSNL